MDINLDRSLIILFDEHLFPLPSLTYPQGILFQGLVGSGGKKRSANINSRQPLDGAAGRQYTKFFFDEYAFGVFKILHFFFFFLFRHIIFVLKIYLNKIKSLTIV